MEKNINISFERCPRKHKHLPYSGAMVTEDSLVEKNPLYGPFYHLSLKCKQTEDKG